MSLSSCCYFFFKLYSLSVCFFFLHGRLLLVWGREDDLGADGKFLLSGIFRDSGSVGCR